jgi:hypothetical protein
VRVGRRPPAALRVLAHRCGHQVRELSHRPNWFSLVLAGISLCNACSGHGIEESTDRRTSEYNNPRFKHENILSVELDPPERTTQDYDGDEMMMHGGMGGGMGMDPDMMSAEEYAMMMGAGGHDDGMGYPDGGGMMQGGYAGGMHHQGGMGYHGGMDGQDYGALQYDEMMARRGMESFDHY